jgi:transcriptional regulator with XRE-family HTH domain
MFYPMRPSPLAHPLAVLRTTIGLTQNQMGALVNRAARTIQSIELGKLPLTEKLALRLAEATGVDEAWLFAGDPQAPPRKGLTLLQAGRGHGVYTREDYEYHRAYLETPILSKDQLTAAIAKAKAEGHDEVDVTALALQKTAVLRKQIEIIELIDSDLVNQLGFILVQTKRTDDMRLVRWKLRRFLEDLAREFSVEIPPTGISVKILELANPKPPPSAEAPRPLRGHRRKAKS